MLTFLYALKKAWDRGGHNRPPPPPAIEVGLVELGGQGVREGKREGERRKLILGLRPRAIEIDGRLRARSCS